MASTAVDNSVSIIRSLYRGEFPETALILGSGLGKFGDDMEQDGVISYNQIADFPQPTVEGHAGKLIIGKIGGVPLLCMQGRMHLYEGHAADKLAVPIRTLQRLGVKRLIITNAAGSLVEDMPPGSLMVLRDHINMTGQNPLIGLNDDDFGPRFFDMTEAYDKAMRQKLVQAAEAENIRLYEGVYAQMTGPSFETPAEINMLGILGAQAVGMSTVPECLVARHCGMRVMAISLMTNMAAGISKDLLSHAETIREADKAYEQVRRLITRFMSLEENNG